MASLLLLSIAIRGTGAVGVGFGGLGPPYVASCSRDGSRAAAVPVRWPAGVGVCDNWPPWGLMLVGSLILLGAAALLLRPVLRPLRRDAVFDDRVTWFYYLALFPGADHCFDGRVQIRGTDCID